MPVAWLTSARDRAFSSAQASLLGSETAACRSASMRSSTGIAASSAAAAICSRPNGPGSARKKSNAPMYSASHQHRHRKHPSDVIGQHRRPVRGPPCIVWVGEVENEDGDRRATESKHGPSPTVNCSSSYIRAGGPLDPSVPVLAPSKTSEIAAASTWSSVTQARHRRSAASSLRSPPTAPSSCS